LQAVAGRSPAGRIVFEREEPAARAVARGAALS